ncbi:MAG TPA: hypothetical protein VMG82_40395 [Candidatus Sulfotelmatobacter sp.]|nr:hypothetical protein [Candidatus Sulfotelmatobacter sp.]
MELLTLGAGGAFAASSGGCGGGGGNNPVAAQAVRQTSASICNFHVEILIRRRTSAGTGSC